MASSTRTVVAIVALPPPTHGQAVVNKAIVGALSAIHVPLKVVDTSPGSLQRGWRYHARRLRLYCAKALPAIVRTKDSLVYSVVEPGLGICYNFLVVAFARLTGARIVLHHHSALYTRAFDRRFDWLARLAGKKALHVALDAFMARDVRAKYPCVESITVAHNASHVPAPVLVGGEDRPLTCGFMSNLSREKGLDVFLDCLRAAQRSGLGLHAILAGPPASAEAETMIADAMSEFPGMLEFVGPVAAASKDAFFRSIDVFLFPTRYRVEGQPLVVIEAMSYGVPVVASQQGYCAELVGAAGVSAPIADFERTALAFLTRCQRDTPFLHEMKREARKRYEILKGEADAQMNDLVRQICS